MNDKKNILIVFLGAVVVFFAYFSYEQNETIGLLNQEIIKQAQHRHKAVMQGYALRKEMEQLRRELFEQEQAAPDSTIHASNLP